jgi:CTP synthase (UTP-ammonia lyase)
MELRIQIELTPGTRLAVLYGGAATAEERTTCNYGLEPSFQHLASSHGMRVGAVDNTGEVRAIERPDHPFFVGTLYQPQLHSQPGAPHPIFTGLLKAAAAR